MAAGQERPLFPLAGGTALMVLGLFCAWQAWLIANQGNATAAVHAAQDQAIRVVADEMAQERNSINLVLATVDPATAMSHPQQTAMALRQRLPQALKLELYSGDLSEVLHANYREFGYAKAAQLMSAQDSSGTPLVQSVSYEGEGRRLSLVISLGSRGQTQAWVWLELPFAPLKQRFDAVDPAGGRLDLREGEAGSGVQLLSHGSTSAEPEPTDKPVAGTVFRIHASLPRAFIVLPHSGLLAAALALIGLLGGAALLRLRWAQPVDAKAGSEPEQDIGLPVVTLRKVHRQPSAEPLTPPTAVRKVADKPAVALDASMFRAYDVRGVVGKGLTDEVARWLGQAIGSVMVEKGLREMVVGRDGRLSGPDLSAALIAGLRATGIDVIDIGAAPTPVVYYAAYHYDTGCGVAITGSHNPPEYNGFKIVVGGETLSEDAIQDLYQRIVNGVAHVENVAGGGLRHVDVASDYIERIVSDVLPERSLKVVVDSGNGIAGAFAPLVLEGIGCEVVPLYCDVDGTFPNHHPDPSDPRNLQDLILAVKSTQADLGLAFDGDGDRLGVVTSTGEVIYPDRLLMLFARDVLSRKPGATIIYDVKCSGHLKGQVLDAGGSPLMWRTGHSLMKAKMRETGAELAGEMSGHFFFKERWYGFDDGIYAAARLLEIIAGDVEGRSAEAIFATLPKSISTPELKIELAEGEHYRFMDQLRQHGQFDDATMITIDGLRADWPDGWGLVRASNTTPVLVLRFEADTTTSLKRIQQVFRQQLLAVDGGLKLPF